LELVQRLSAWPGLIESQRRRPQNVRARVCIAERSFGNRFGQAHTRYVLHPIAGLAANNYSADMIEAAFTASAFNHLRKKSF
jgi:hypothetical protein